MCVAPRWLGCLTTISTFAVELDTLPLPKAYAYGLASIGVSDAILLVLYGSVRWTLAPAVGGQADCQV